MTVYRSGQYVELTLTFDEQTTAQNNTQQDPAPQETSSQNGQGGQYYNPWDYFFN